MLPPLSYPQAMEAPSVQRTTAHSISKGFPSIHTRQNPPPRSTLFWAPQVQIIVKESRPGSCSRAAAALRSKHPPETAWLPAPARHPCRASPAPAASPGEDCTASLLLANGTFQGCVCTTEGAQKLPTGKCTYRQHMEMPGSMRCIWHKPVLVLIAMLLHITVEVHEKSSSVNDVSQ